MELGDYFYSSEVNTMRGGYCTVPGTTRWTPCGLRDMKSTMCLDHHLDMMADIHLCSSFLRQSVEMHGDM